MPCECSALKFFRCSLMSCFVCRTVCGTYVWADRSHDSRVGTVVHQLCLYVVLSMMVGRPVCMEYGTCV